MLLPPFIWLNVRFGHLTAIAFVNLVYATRANLRDYRVLLRLAPRNAPYKINQMIEAQIG